MPDVRTSQNVRRPTGPNLVTHPSVARALAEQALRLHGWVYDIASGGVQRIPHDEATPGAAPRAA
ncbi:carbonic anhydrase [Streptomyces noursei]|uniref:carbonic anhydrase n=1 Tax=Streptomyces noursei TaxID=1971 RepID=UPI0021A94BB8|nr:carbonic anhydrase [Streptomyces noursei]UWS70023.1 hypothetical protein N1H47_01375 [Streptomyces noursei]